MSARCYCSGVPVAVPGSSGGTVTASSKDVVKHFARSKPTKTAQFEGTPSCFDPEMSVLTVSGEKVSVRAGQCGSFLHEEAPRVRRRRSEVVSE